MDNYKIKPFQSAHADEIILMGEFENYSKDYSTDALETQDAWTGFYNDQPIVCGGINPIWEGVADVWIIMKKGSNKHKFFMLKNIKEKFKETITKRNYHRVQAVIRSDFTDGLRFAKWFDMTPEGVMKKYGPDSKDYIMVARIK